MYLICDLAILASVNSETSKESGASSGICSSFLRPSVMLLCFAGSIRNGGTIKYIRFATIDLLVQTLVVVLCVV